VGTLTTDFIVMVIWFIIFIVILWYFCCLYVSETVIGSHENAIRCIDFCSELSLVISGGWDAVVKLWDPRSNAAVGSLAQPDRVCKQNVTIELKEELFAESDISYSIQIWCKVYVSKMLQLN